MSDPKVALKYEHSVGYVRMETDSGTTVSLSGECADRVAEKLNLWNGKGETVISEREWDKLARGSFR